MSTELRVLNCLHRSHPGGAHWRVTWVADHLEAHGVHTIVAFPRDEATTYETALRRTDRDLVRLTTPAIQRNVLANVRFLAALPTTTLAYREALRRLEIDVVHVNGVTLLQPVLAAASLGIPVVWHFNDMQTPSWYVRSVLPLMRRRQVRPVVATEAILDHYGLRDALGERWTYLPAPLPNRAGSRSDPLTNDLANVPTGARVIGFVGNLHHVKGAHDFLTAALPLLERDTDLHAVLVGPGLSSTEHRAYERGLHAKVAASLAKDRVHFVGFQNNVYAWMEHFDVLAFPSYSEACPIVVLEAMEIGLPIAATAVGDVPKMLQGSGLPLLHPGDTVSLESTLRMLLELDPAQRDELAKYLRHGVRERYSLERVADLHANLYRELMDHRSTEH